MKNAVLSMLLVQESEKNGLMYANRVQSALRAASASDRKLSSVFWCEQWECAPGCAQRSGRLGAPVGTSSCWLLQWHLDVVWRNREESCTLSFQCHCYTTIAARSPSEVVMRTPLHLISGRRCLCCNLKGTASWTLDWILNVDKLGVLLVWVKHKQMH